MSGLFYSMICLYDSSILSCIAVDLFHCCIVFHCVNIAQFIHSTLDGHFNRGLFLCLAAVTVLP